MNLFNIKEMVEKTLVGYPDTRSDDDLLIMTVYRNYFQIRKQPFDEVMKNRKEAGLPSFESIRRCRQKLQEEHEFLRADRKTSKARYEKQVEYLELAEGGTNG